LSPRAHLVAFRKHSSGGGNRGTSAPNRACRLRRCRAARRPGRRRCAGAARGAVRAGRHRARRAALRRARRRLPRRARRRDAGRESGLGQVPPCRGRPRRRGADSRRHPRHRDGAERLHGYRARRARRVPAQHGQREPERREARRCRAGARAAPDLSSIGAMRTPATLQRALLDPNDALLPTNRPVRAVLRDGRVVTGRRLNEDTFTVQILDANERLVSLARADLREYTVGTTALMTSYATSLNDDERADLVAYLLSLKGPN